ncbi:hypothetical protein P7C71_g6234, partial [Lecanoromycetidae sp. Uapishka_2]
MRLLSSLSHLRDIVKLYYDYDYFSRNTFRLDRHNDFYHIINSAITTIFHDAQTLTLWTHSSPRTHAWGIPTLQSIASKVIAEWDRHVDFIENTSNQRAKHVDFYGDVVWRLRRKDCMRTARGMLRLLDERELEE